MDRNRLDHNHTQLLVIMGICSSKDVQDQNNRNAEIEKELQVAKMSMRNEVKMLLLGKYLKHQVALRQYILSV
jgi:hypothetical protein